MSPLTWLHSSDEISHLPNLVKVLVMRPHFTQFRVIAHFWVFRQVDPRLGKIQYEAKPLRRYQFWKVRVMRCLEVRFVFVKFYAFKHHLPIFFVLNVICDGKRYYSTTKLEIIILLTRLASPPPFLPVLWWVRIRTRTSSIFFFTCTRNNGIICIIPIRAILKIYRVIMYSRLVHCTHIHYYDLLY